MQTSKDHTSTNFSTPQIDTSYPTYNTILFIIALTHTYIYAASFKQLFLIKYCNLLIQKISTWKAILPVYIHVQVRKLMKGNFHNNNNYYSELA